MTVSLRSFCFLATLFFVVEARHVPFYRHEAVHSHNKRQDSASPVMAVATTLPSGVIAIITPSPGASPVTVTTQSQIVTIYDPQFTLCALPPIDLLPVTPTASASLTSPYRNYSISVPTGSGACTTIYSPVVTMICSTTLTGLASKIPITACAQEVTFSSEYGYTLFTPTVTPTGNMTGLNATGITNFSLATITPGLSIQTLTTYFIAPWHELTAGTPPPDVIRKVCTTFTNGTEECIRAYEIWRTGLVTLTATSTLSVNFTTTIHGPSQMVVFETFIANITEILTTVSFSTSVETEYETSFETTHTALAIVSTGPTVYSTRTVEEVSSWAGSTRTTTIHMTTTVLGGTTTITMSSGSTGAAAASSSATSGVVVGGD